VFSGRALLVACVIAALCPLAPALSSAAQVTLAWDPNTEPDLAGYKLYYGISSRSYQFSVDVGNLTSFPLSGLLEGQIYYFAATAYNFSGNESDFSNEVSTTIADVTSPVISAVAASNISSSEATITWATDEASDSQVEYGPTPAYGSVTPADTSLLTAHAMTLTGLLATTTYHYRVNSRDAAGNLSTTADFTLTTLAGVDLTPPAVSLTAPTSGSTVLGTVTVAVSATDNVGVVGVQFKLDGADLGAEVTAEPYALSWTTTTATNGVHTLTAVARDAAGNTTTSSVVSITVANDDTIPPTVAITAPVDGVHVLWFVIINAQAADNVGVSDVQIYLDSALIATVACGADLSCSVSVPWPIKGPAGVAHSIYAVATDTFGNSSTSTPITVFK
jgi:Big-like domain-containing protein/purple acid phosphatase-like protein